MSLERTRFSFVAALTSDGVIRDRDKQVLLNSSAADEDVARAEADLWLARLRREWYVGDKPAVPVRISMGRH